MLVGVVYKGIQYINEPDKHIHINTIHKDSPLLEYLCVCKNVYHMYIPV